MDEKWSFVFQQTIKPRLKTFQPFPSRSCLARLQTTLPYASEAYGLMLARLPSAEPAGTGTCCRDALTGGCILQHFLSHEALFIWPSLVFGWPNKPLGSAFLGTGTGSPVQRETGALTLTPTLVSFSLSENRKPCKTHKMHTLLQLEMFAPFHCCEPKHFRYLIFFFPLCSRSHLEC